MEQIWHSIVQIWNSIVVFFQNIWNMIRVPLENFFQVVGVFIFQKLIIPVQNILLEIKEGKVLGEIVSRFKYNTWSDVCDKVTDSKSWLNILILIISGIVFLLSVGDGGFFGAAIVGLITAAILFVVITTIVWLWENLLSPIFPVVLVILASLGLVIGAFVSIRNYVRSIKEYKDPWKHFKDKGRFVEENAARRSYFFGPGQNQVACIFKGAWKRNISSLKDIVSNRINAEFSFILRMVFAPFVWSYLIFYILSVLTFGSVLTLIIGLVHFVIILVFMLVTRLIFTIVWLIDRIYLMIRGIYSICPHCKKHYRIPEFACVCGKKQHNLVPSSYGIFRRKCVCGKKLPTTFFNGRSRLKPYCPHCGDALVSSDSRQFGLTIVGASSSGKTAVITSFFHIFQEDISELSNLSAEVPPIQKNKFDRLNRYYNGSESLRGTIVDETTEMYSLLLHMKKGGTKVQFSLYDVAGEVFDTPDLNAIVYANDMAISQGIIFTLDPLSSPVLKKAARRSDFAAQREMNLVLNNFVTFLHTLSDAEKIGQKVSRPLAVVIMKIDNPGVREYIDLDDLHFTLDNIEEEYRLQVQDRICRDFLLQIGLSDFIMAVDAQFSNVHFFPVSATGGVERGHVFKPSENLTDPFYWIIRQKDSVLTEALEIPDTLS